jgi:hypothetical protein
MINLRTAGLLALLSASVSPARATPSEVVIIRHAEKPDAGPDVCVPTGVCRAVALASDFVPQFGTPDAIYAMAPGGKADSSVRPIQTVTPLAQALHKKINSNYTRKQLSAVAADVLSNDGGMVLLAWEHKIIPDLVQAFCSAAGAQPGACSTVPAKWPGGDVFDQAWILSFGGDGKVSSFRIENENIPSAALNCGAPISAVVAPGAAVPQALPCATSAASNDAD